MVFTSWAFAAFITVVLVALRLLKSRRPRQLLLLFASCFFYAYWRLEYLLLLLTPSLIDYVCALRIEDSAATTVRKRWLVTSLVTNLGLLAYFKYTNFFILTAAAIGGWQAVRLDIVLPVGISFYTFKTLSYTIDVYRREIPACRSLWQYAMYVTYFPELVAGPIVRASVFLPQLRRSLQSSRRRLMEGLEVALLGLTKKLVIADQLSPFVDAVFAQPAAYSPLTVTSAVIAYSLQIYCDFSGYSDIAIGISRVIGFDLPENFNMPYRATSITDFWRRWHMTLSAWLRDYLYISLGGNRRGRLRTYLNLMITMVLGGLWHGASWTFVAWGALHGLALAAHKLWLHRVGARPSSARAVLGWAGTYAFVCVAWVFFRAQSFGDAVTVLRKLAWFDARGIVWWYAPGLGAVALVVLGHAFGTAAARGEARMGRGIRRIAPPGWALRLYAAAEKPFALRPHPAAGLYVLLPLPGFAGGFILALWIALLYLFAATNSSPFIYFQF